MIRVSAAGKRVWDLISRLSPLMTERRSLPLQLNLRLSTSKEQDQELRFKLVTKRPSKVVLLFATKMLGRLSISKRTMMKRRRWKRARSRSLRKPLRLGRLHHSPWKASKAMKPHDLHVYVSQKVIVSESCKCWHLSFNQLT